MGKYAVVYWSGTGNTEAMAEEIAEGIRAAGKQAEPLLLPSFQMGRLQNMMELLLAAPLWERKNWKARSLHPCLKRCFRF